MKKAISANGAPQASFDLGVTLSPVISAFQAFSTATSRKLKSALVEMQVSRMQTVLATMSADQLAMTNIDSSTLREHARALVLGDDA